MAQPAQGSDVPSKAITLGKSPQKDGLPPILLDSLKVGGVAGTVGLFVGATAGIIRTTTPFLFSLVSGAQFALLGSTFYGARATLISAWTPPPPPQQQSLPSQSSYDGASSPPLSTLPPTRLTAASALAGTFAGLIAGLARGPRNILPGMFVMSLLGAGGQAGVNAYTHRLTTSTASSSSTSSSSNNPKKSWMDSPYIPLKRISDEEYAAQLEERVLAYEVEIALVDDKLDELRKERAREELVRAAAEEVDREKKGSSAADDVGKDGVLEYLDMGRKWKP